MKCKWDTLFVNGRLAHDNAYIRYPAGTHETV